MLHHTIADIRASLKILDNPTTHEAAGKPLTFEVLSSGTLKIDDRYQRQISKNALEKYGTLQRDQLQPVLVSRRPESCGEFAGDYIIDGQNRAVMHDASGLEETNDVNTWLPCVVKEWPEGIPLVKCTQGEARLFESCNFNRKNPSKVDRYRAAYHYGDEEAIRMHTYLVNLNLTIDNFGSTRNNALEVYTPNPFFYTILQDLEDAGKKLSGFNLVQNGLDLYKAIYKPTRIQGQVFRTMVHVDLFVETALTNLRQKHFKKWLVNPDRGLSYEFDDKALVKEHSSFVGHRYVLHERIIPKYNHYVRHTVKSKSEKTYLTIGEQTLKMAASINPKFAHPENHLPPWTGVGK